jgi:hypothetical protein
LETRKKREGKVTRKQERKERQNKGRGQRKKGKMSIHVNVTE